MNKERQKYNAAGKYLNKWLILLATVLTLGGIFAFGILMFLGDLAGQTVQTTESVTFDPIWMVGMIPLMLLIAIPVTIIIARLVYKHFDKLTVAMSDVANGKPDVHIDMEKAGAFTKIYEDFNKMAAEIAGIQVLRNTMTDNFSHELKTPAASITGFAKILLEDDLPEEKQKKYLGIILKESERLTSLANNNLMLSKIDAQEIITGKRSFNLGKQIQEIAIGLESSWAGKNINLSAELPDTEYFGNPDLMESVWQNLLYNAIKFTPKHGDINISLCDMGSSITVSVSDTGIGMSAEVLEHIFERYYQGDTSHAGEGHGLGLSIVKRIVNLCGGEIRAESREGEGSTFTVLLPKNI